MTMDYHHPYNVYPEYYCPSYQGPGYPFPSQQSHPPAHPQHRQQMPNPQRNFNNNVIGNPNFICPPPPPPHHQQQPPPQQQQPPQHYFPYQQQGQQQQQQQRQHSSYTSPYVPNFLVSSGTGLTPTLTPTTLATIEQSFMELQNNQQNGGRDPVTQSGFVPPVVDPGHSAEQSQDSYDYSSSDGEWEPKAKRGRMSADMKDVNLIVTAHGTINATPQRKYTRRNKDEKVRGKFLNVKVRDKRQNSVVILFFYWKGR
ncbi:putative uncharacterized protein DDB_G0294196 isoform X1 [Aplysia californica]|uniref:Uncharacterized protein n=1 Tax=Aplysia californica TaxID=6500 RepID=A0ABM0K9S2_APLCA|nr:putative uncharacterized protein DDB_G0294196 isoform X1 [Aplysia californica]